MASARRIARTVSHPLKHTVACATPGGAANEREQRERALGCPEKKAARPGYALSPHTLTAEMARAAASS